MGPRKEKKWSVDEVEEERRGEGEYIYTHDIKRKQFGG